MGFAFKFSNQSTQYPAARLGELVTPHGTIQTPAFIFCATKASIKGLSPHQVKAEKTQIILANTYHLMLQPGPDLVEQFGKLHRFMGWDGPMLTDSGGYQIFSLGHGSVSSEIKGKRGAGGSGSWKKTLLSISEEGAIFKSYLDGSSIRLTPERSIQIQKKLGADLIVVLDECTPFHVSKEYTEASMRRSHRWALRSLEEFNRLDDGSQKLYGIVQGGIYPEMRKESTDFVNDHPFFGHAVGGSLGASKEQMYDIVGLTMSQLDRSRPVHLLGIGHIRDIFFGVKQGIDTFDCVHPTRLARHGGALVKGGDGKGREHINLKNAEFKLDNTPIEKDCQCFTCQNHSKGYLHHLIKAQEALFMSLISLHNIHFMNRLMGSIRSAIANNTLDQAEKEWLGEMKAIAEPVPLS